MFETYFQNFPMKNIILTVFTLFVTVVSAQEIQWMSMEKALEAQKENPKKIFMDVYTDWCGPCRMLDKKTFHNPDVAKYVNDNFYAVKFNAEGTEAFTYQGNYFSNPNYVEGKRGRNSAHQFATALKVRGYPSMVFFDEKGTLIFPITGFHNVQQLEVFLKLMGTNDYKKVTSQKMFDEYQKTFKNTFKG